MTATDIKSIFHQFRVQGSWKDSAPFGSGHIHHTRVIRTAEWDAPDYILQKINHHVFPPVAGMMDNIRKVTRHIRDKNPSVKNGDQSAPALQVLEVIPTKDGMTHYTDPGRNHWRMYQKVEPGISYDVVPNENVAYEAGKAFGKFLDDLKDLPADGLNTVIPDFHSVEFRYDQLNKAVEADPVGRAAEVEAEIGCARNYIERMRIIPQKEKEGSLPIRVTHNDTKLNNILFDEHDRAVCIIDLDTVMAGLSLYDFGDLIRTAANTAEEDEADPDRVHFSLPVFKSITQGFLDSARQFLTPDEIDLMPLSAQYMTYLMGIRFLADYLSGDVYYKTRDHGQNLRRCRTQFVLIERMTDHYEECGEIVRQHFDKMRSAGR